MVSRRVRVVVLCEGEQDFRFAYRCLVECGWRRDQIAAKFSPPGKGSAYDYVLAQYPVEVRANRQGQGQRDLLVLIDADTRREDGRRKQVEQHLRRAREPARGDSERIALWVPTRQLETWVHFLMHGVADEQTDYKRLHKVRDEDRPPAAQKFARLLARGQPLPPGAVPSMQRAVKEFERLRVTPAGTGPARRPRRRA
jgi:hypothetical protein